MRHIYGESRDFMQVFGESGVVAMETAILDCTQTDPILNFRLIRSEGRSDESLVQFMTIASHSFPCL